MGYLADEIGDSFKNWQKGSFHLITTPTGSGKTTFVFQKLLDHVISNNQTILYLVNRKILKQQLNEKIKWNIVNNIRVKTYQTLEKK